VTEKQLQIHPDVERFLAAHTQAIIATIRKDGSPHLTNVLSHYSDGKMFVSITETRAKYKHLVREPRASLHVGGDNFWQYVVVEGGARLVHMPEALVPLRQLYESLSGKPHPDWDEYDEAMRQDRRVLLELMIEKLTEYNVVKSGGQ
jgi:PPOX class probable F420-dependent enzyme